jgi:hypothetical protein
VPNCTLSCSLSNARPKTKLQYVHCDKERAKWDEVKDNDEAEDDDEVGEKVASVLDGESMIDLPGEVQQPGAAVGKPGVKPKCGPLKERSLRWVTHGLLAGGGVVVGGRGGDGRWGEWGEDISVLCRLVGGRLVVEREMGVVLVAIDVVNAHAVIAHRLNAGEASGSGRFLALVADGHVVRHVVDHAAFVVVGTVGAERWIAEETVGRSEDVAVLTERLGRRRMHQVGRFVDSGTWASRDVERIGRGGWGGVVVGVGTVVRRLEAEASNQGGPLEL